MSNYFTIFLTNINIPDTQNIWNDSITIEKYINFVLMLTNLIC